MLHSETMRMTFVDKNSIFCSSAMIIIFLVLMSSVSVRVNGWEHDEDGRGPVVYRKEGENCTIKNGESGICRKLTSCGVYYEGLKQKAIEYNFLVRCIFIDKDEVICCPLEEKPSVRTSKTPEAISINSKSTTNNGIQRPSQVACKNFSEVNPAGFAFHIIGGAAVEPGQFPHVGGLIFSDGGGADLDNRCGSSLISERYVLTAAHCVHDSLSQPLFVRFGVVKWNSVSSEDPPYDAEIENVTVHPGYRYPVRYHDIAVIRLRRNVEFSTVIRPACLYSDLRDIDSDIQLAVVGWGVTSFLTKARSEVLLMTNVTSVDLNECNATHIAYGTDRKYRDGLNEGQYCAFDREMKKDSCQSDSGGPLEFVQNGQSTIVGIVSFGLKCASKVPSVYVRVAYYLDWIESIVWPS